MDWGKGRGRGTIQEPAGNRSHRAVDSLMLQSPIPDAHPRKDGRGKAADHPVCWFVSWSTVKP